eukprot:s166_g4.t2
MPSVPFKYSVAHVSHGREHSEYESLFQFQKAFELKALASMVLQTVDETLPYMDRHIIASAPSVADLLPEALKDEAGEASLAAGSPRAAAFEIFRREAPVRFLLWIGIGVQAAAADGERLAHRPASRGLYPDRPEAEQSTGGHGLQEKLTSEADTRDFQQLSCLWDLTTGQGYTISIEDDELVQQAQMRVRNTSTGDPASAHVYGELTANGVRQLSGFLGLNEATEASFVDLGAGVGKAVVQIYLEHPRVRRVLGVELSPGRAKNGREAIEELRAGALPLLRRRALLGQALEEGVIAADPLTSTGEVEFVEGDMFQVDLRHATHVYMASTSWCPSMLRKLADKLLKEATNLQAAASLKRLPEGLPGFEEVDAQLQTSWTKRDPAGSRVYIYRLLDMKQCLADFVNAVRCPHDGCVGTATFSASYYEGSMDNLSVVADWVARNRFPGVWALGEGNFYEFTHSDRPAVLVALGPEVGEDLEQEIRGAQREFSQEFLFGALNGSHWSEELKMFNIHPQEPGPHSARAAPQQQLLGSHSVAPADLNAPYSRAELKRVKAVRFTMFDADTLTAYSVAEISSNEIYRNGQPVHGGVNDPRLGPIDVRTPCETCGQGIKSCPGHWGHLTLARPMQGPRRAD